ncbi:ABC transporter permease [Actinospica durhamensis]|uniref:ABC transporter permease n=1 Tax=Actinospica durhamensis TaxID=1508375 RepID=A0A941IS06_9ACTN|nr:ABC transporter permease [Actinospica durhamensis]MBR7837944.1 ABC transporter permease [Actinospica durhamensis]
MLAFLARRLAAAVLLLFVISFLSFLLLSLAQVDVARQLLGLQASASAVAHENAALGLDRPLLARYADWLGSAVRGNLGTSWFTGQDVAQTIGQRLPVTLSLVLATTVVTAIASLALGLWAGTRRGVADRIVQILGVAGYALPGFLVTLLIVVVFGVDLKWFPATGYIPITRSFTGWLSTITLPTLALSLGAVAGLSQQVRSAVAAVAAQDYVRTLRARGLSGRSVVLKHVLRGACAPALTVLGLQFVGLLGGAVVVEDIFALPGIGAMTVADTSDGDVPVIMALVMVSVIGVVLINLAVDLLIGLLNPKARLT